MNKIYIYDLFISSILAAINIKYIKLPVYKILTGLIWGAFIFASLLINFDYILHFITFIIISIAGIAIYILLKVPVINDISIIFWLLYGASVIVIVSLIISKKLMFINMYNEGELGSKGNDGLIGLSGTLSYPDSLQDKCYLTLVQHIDDYLKKNKLYNNIDFVKDEPQFKNLYFKNILKRICYSKEFGYNIYNINNNCNNTTPIQKQEYSNTKCNNNADCNINQMCQLINTTTTKKGRYCINRQNTIKDNFDKYKDVLDSEERLSLLTKKLLHEILSWVKLILKNNKHENTKLNEKLGFSKDIITTKFVDNRFIDEYKYNSKLGHKFLGNYFYTDRLFDDIDDCDEDTEECNDCTNPFITIKKREYYKWGMN